jgi:hypothetical protein
MQFGEPVFHSWSGKTEALFTDAISVMQQSGATSALRFVRAQPLEYLFGEFYDNDIFLRN